MSSRYLAISLAMFLASPAVMANEYTIDADHSYVGFQVRHLMITNVRGQFNTYEGTVKYDEKAPDKTEIGVTIDVASINTKVTKRDEHLRSPDFFDVAKYPKITFKSKKVKANGKKLQVIGDLTLRDVTKEVVLDVAEVSKETKDPWGGTRRNARVIGKLNRKDFGMTWNKALETGGVALGDEIQLEFDIQLIKKA